VSASPVRLRWRVLRFGAAAVVAVAIGVGAWHGYRAVLSRPVEKLVFAGELDRLSQADLDAFTRAIHEAAPEARTMENVRDAARRVPWVREATVRRRFPDSAEVTFRAYRALARWSDTQLVDPDGAVFTASTANDLPRFRGGEAAAPAMAHEYPALAARLAPLGSPITELHLSARGAWEVLLASGLALELGRGETAARVQRLVEAWPRIGAAAAATRYADLRYANGFALRRAADLNPQSARADNRRK
jgi:cell division protein FtsQ